MTVHVQRGLHLNVRRAYIDYMTDLERWMTLKKETDLSLSQKLNCSRAYVSRLRRGLLGASKARAHEIEAITGLPWYTFIEPLADAPRGEQGAAAE